MPAHRQIWCIVRSDSLNHHRRIRCVGGVNPDGSRWKISEAAAIAGIEEGHWRFFIEHRGAAIEVQIAVSKYGSKYLKTPLDQLHPHALLALPECP